MLPTGLVPGGLSDHELLSELSRRAACEREATATVVALLADVDVRRLYLGESCRSLFTYCTERLHFSEHAAYHRIEAARAVRRFPVILGHLVSGALTVTTVALLRPHLTDQNHDSLLQRALGRSKREVELLVRSVAPLPDVRTSIRKVSGPAELTRAAAAAGAATGADTGAAELIPLSPPLALGDDVSPPPSRPAPAIVAVANRPAEIRLLSPAAYSLRVTLSAEAHAKLRRAQDLLRHTVPNGDSSLVIDRALSLLVEDLERTKFAKQKQPRQPVRKPGRARQRGSRHIPADVRRTVLERDQGRCAFVGPAGRCTETGMLEFHHRVPFADGGEATAANVELQCTRHNQHEAKVWNGVTPVCAERCSPWTEDAVELGPDRVATTRRGN